ncbi:M36 family metallopeptidase [Longispora sp. K20-0274]|uniref:M36 family metallopeptidase n=1 Tax=Longispora sp. K20-0274 TaxID=3088255 RepID=UPI00399A83D2
MRTPIALFSRRQAATGVAVLAVLGAWLQPTVARADPPRPPGAATKGERPPDYDARTGASMASLARTAGNPQVRALRDALGPQGIVDIDPVTGTPRLVAKVDGFLTGPGRADAGTVALDYLRAHPDVFGLSPAAVAGLTLRKDYVDIAGTHHLHYVQRVAGVPVYGNGVKAHVTKAGELIQVDGSPVADLPAKLAPATMTAADARAAAARDVHGTSVAGQADESAGPDRATRFAGGDRAQLVVFRSANGPRLGWQTMLRHEAYLHVIDARTGWVLLRRNLAQHDSGTTWENYPGAAKGGKQQSRDLTGPGWLPAGSQTLDGNVAHVYLDVNDNAKPDAGEEVGPSAPGKFAYPFTDFNAAVGPPCSALYPCSWNPAVANSWKTNAKQNAVQLLAFAGTFHDHLAAAPIGFTSGAGNFEAKDGDAVQVRGLDGADTAAGLPDGDHIDNANMATFPDGTPPQMRMYLFHNPADPADPFIAGNSGDVADVVYHEYTHGLSNRLVVDANGVSTLGGIQAGSMGEAWSDWYAMDFLVGKGLFTDTKADGEIQLGRYLGAGANLLRTQPLDCAVGPATAKCPGGGYTYGRFGKIAGRPEVHADGEIWGETLWDLRTALGSDLTRNLVTRAMELSPANPSFLDQRNAILRADNIVGAGKHQAAIWKVFAARGMGWFAGTLDGDDVAPAEDFSMPPAAGTPRGSLAGTVTDAGTGLPISGAVVVFGGHKSSFAGSYTAVTDNTGAYTINNITAGTYPKVSATAAGYDQKSSSVSVNSGPNALSWSLRRDWAARSGGGSVFASTGHDFTSDGCGPGNLIDQSPGNGWVSDVVIAGAGIEPRGVTVKLPDVVNVEEFTIDPASSCGLGGSASVGDYTVETSADGVAWQTAATGHFTPADRHRMNPVTPTGATGTGVRYIRFTATGTQLGDIGGTCPGAFSACTYVSASELGVHGALS